MARIEGEVVVDTSVLAKLFFPEKDNHKAELLHELFVKQKVRYTAPDFLAIEFLNVLWLKLRRKDVDDEAGRNILSLFLALLTGTRIVPCSTFLDDVLTASIEHDHAAYDMAFLALAEKLGVPFVTADEKLYSKVGLRSQMLVLLRDLEA